MRWLLFVDVRFVRLFGVVVLVLGVAHSLSAHEVVCLF